MQPEPQSNGHDPAPELAVLPASDSAPCPSSKSAVENQNSKIENPRERRCHGKIAKLPKVLRDLINYMFDQGLPYRLIIEKLQASTDPPLPYPISEMDLSRWYAKGYQRYLAQQDHLDYLRGNREAARDMVANDDTTTLPEATLQIIASQYFDLLGDFSPDLLKGKLAEDPLKYTRFLNVFARLVREIVHLKKYRELCAKQSAAGLREKDPKRELDDPDYALLVDQMDRAFKIRRRPPPSAPDSSSRGNEASAAPPATSAQPAPTPQLENQSSKIENANPPPDTPAGHQPQTVPFDDALVNRKSEVVNPPPPVEQTSTTSVSSPEDHAVPELDDGVNRTSEIVHPPELCPHCGLRLPGLLPNGQRPRPACPACQNPLFPPGTRYDKCQFCGRPHRIHDNNERETTHCYVCGNFLPPIGQRYMTHCRACSCQLARLTCDGKRLSDRCPNCDEPAPLLEPNPPTQPQ